MGIESYTFEDYIKDFELDYLGFDGVPDEPVSDLCSGKIGANEIETKADDCDADIHSGAESCLRTRKVLK